MSFTDTLAWVDRAVRETLGGPVVYTPGVGAPVTVTGIFDDAYQLVDLQAGVTSSGPAVFLTLADLPSDPAADSSCTITVNGVTYKPHEPIKKDGQGGVLLHLHKV